jgi:hypothetical protein
MKGIVRRLSQEREEKRERGQGPKVRKETKIKLVCGDVSVISSSIQKAMCCRVTLNLEFDSTTHLRVPRCSAGPVTSSSGGARCCKMSVTDQEGKHMVQFV